MILRTCELCRDSAEPGWLCAAHPTQPWCHDDCGSEGVPCICNPEGAVQWQEVFAERKPDGPGH